MLVRDAGRARIPRDPRLAERVEIRTDRDAFLADGPQVVAECAGHAAVREHGVAVLEAGCDQFQGYLFSKPVPEQNISRQPCRPHQHLGPGYSPSLGQGSE